MEVRTCRSVSEEATGGNVRDAGQAAVTAPQLRDPVDIVDAVLQGEDRGVAAHQGTERTRRFFRET